MSASSARAWDGIVVIVLTLLGWSSIPLFLRHFAHLVDPWTSNGWRYGFSALIWLPVLLLGLRAGTLPPGLWRAALVPSLINAAAQAVFCWAHYKIDPGLLSFGLRANIVFVTIGAAIFFAAERRIIRAPGFLLGVLMVIAGTVGTVLLGAERPRGATLDGVLLAVASGAGFAAYALAVRKWMHGVNAIKSFAAISLYTAAALVALMLALGDRAGAPALDLLHRPCLVGPIAVPGGQFTNLLVSAVIGIALGHVAYYFAINRLGLAVSAGVVQLQPFFVSLGSLALFGERLNAKQWTSGSVAIAGAVVILVVQHRQKRADVAAAPGREPAPREQAAEFADLPPDHVAAAVASEMEAPGDRPRGA